MRVTDKLVRETFVTFCELGRETGFNTTGWILQLGDVRYGNTYRIHVTESETGRKGSHPFGDHLGTTPREAYDRLGAFIHALAAVCELQRETVVCHTPDDH